jgi:septum formation protein
VLILASASPRRRRLLEKAGIPFRVEAPEVEEATPERGDPHAVARANAELKARAVRGRAVLGADTVVAVGDRILGQPRDPGHARELLELLSGTTHRVVTGIALAVDGVLRVSSVETKVTMRRLTPSEIEEYVESGEGLGKAGGYAIQETADRFVESLDGPFDNVVGLPVDEVRRLLEEAGL